MLAAAKGVRQHAGLMLDAMIHDFERATGPWHAEWMAIPEAFVLTAGALHQAKFALGGLIVDEARMAQNLDMSKGLIVAEAVMMHLASLMAGSRRTTSSTPHAASSTNREARWRRCLRRTLRFQSISTGLPSTG